jgi:hypothetical protein
MNQHENWHLTYGTTVTQAEPMTTTQTRAAIWLSPLVAGVRTAVERRYYD